MNQNPQKTQNQNQIRTLKLPLKWLRYMIVFWMVTSLGCKPAGQTATDQEDFATGTVADTSPPHLVGTRIVIDTETLEELGYSHFEPVKEASGFLIGGENSNETIAGLKELAGISIADLENQMRPGATGEEGSDAGFLGPNESLLELLAADNEFVLEKLKTNHQNLARTLMLLGYYAKKMAYKNPVDVNFQGQNFRVKSKQWKGYQHSPFQDGTKTFVDVTITNLNSKKTLEYSLLVPHMIERYGFYEGHGTSYRVDPAKIADVLGL